MTDVLDLVGLALITAGVAGGLWPLIGWWSLVVAGLVLLGTSASIAVRQRAQQAKRPQRGGGV